MRTNVRLSDLQQQGQRTPWKLMNVKIPDTLLARIDEVAATLQCAKTAVVIALLNEGLDAFAEQSGPDPKARKKR
ncbi:MAG: hypothetical protein SF182_29335 [Deltaproteobacteria bacterium]|nr:hypothetical protein [Deltaproteobacteria bacterium]